MIREFFFKKTNNVGKAFTTPSRQVVQATKLYTLAPNNCGNSVWHLLHVTFLARRILVWVLGFWKPRGFMVYVTVISSSTYQCSGESG